MNRWYFKRIIILLAVFIAAIFLFILLLNFGKQSSKSRKISINNHILTIEIADNDNLRTKGLSGRIFLPKDSGMLFIYEKPGFYKFWMKEMQFPLDFIWIRDDKIVDITENVPIPDKINRTLPLYTSQYPADKILEVDAGLIKSIGVRIGEKIKYER